MTRREFIKNPTAGKCSICETDFRQPPARTRKESGLAPFVAYFSTSNESDNNASLSYPHYVCAKCNSRAVNKHGQPPEHLTLYDGGDNPVFIDGIKCWRRYKFGGYITMRDIYDCKENSEFYDRIIMDVPILYGGIDGCKAGWFMVTLNSSTKWKTAIYPNIFSLWKECKEMELILIDIPVGLPDSGKDERDCDIAAREVLGKARASSVFPTPCRPAVNVTSYEKASETNYRLAGRKLSLQSWGIVPKIREVDALNLRDSSVRKKIRESHPEVCFWGLNDLQPMKFAKKTVEGQAERRKVLEKSYENSSAMIEDAFSHFKRSQVSKDDILDALSLAVTASQWTSGRYTLPYLPKTDSHGLKMEMLFHTRKKFSWTVI